MKWEPWKTEEKEFNDILDILEPPCKNCRFWKPHRTYDESLIYTGIQCCISKEIWKDFSCYKEKDD